MQTQNTAKTTKERMKDFRARQKSEGVRHLKITVTAQEFALLEMKANLSGEKVSTYAKKALFNQLAGTRHLNNDELDQLRAYLIEIRRIGTNINQMAHSGHIGFTLNSDEIRYQLRYLDDLVHTAFGKKSIFQLKTNEPPEQPKTPQNPTE
jgi:hypothetical protein